MLVYTVFCLTFLFFHSLNSAQKDVLRQIPRMTEITLPTNYIDWKSKQLNLPGDTSIKTARNSPNHREWPKQTEDPRYVLVRSEEPNTRQLGNEFYSLLNVSFYIMLLIEKSIIFHKIL